MGREAQLSGLSELLERERLVTLTGVPGIGKTRLALELRHKLKDAYPGGVRLVELTPVARPAHLPRAVASALSIDEQPGQDVTDTLIARLRRRGSLLVLDNCEHVVGACARLVDDLLSACPTLSVLATSREPLGCPAESVWPVPALSLPAEGNDAAVEDVLDSAAGRLFVDRAAAVRPGFSLTGYVAPHVAEICRRLDGIPLAIELAAARVGSLTPREIAQRLDDRFDLLIAGDASRPNRHQTLEAAIDWSHDLLTAPERTLLRRLSVFRGGFEVEAVEAICAGGEIISGQSSALLERLEAKSLIASDRNGSEAGRWRLLETIGAYAAERLEGAGEQAALRDAHAGFHLALAERAEPEVTGRDQQLWLERLEASHADVRHALEWFLVHGNAQDALRLVGALVLFWRVRCHFSEGRELLDAALSTVDQSTSPARAKALWGKGFLTLMAGDAPGAVPIVEESLSAFRSLQDPRGSARALLILGNCLQPSDSTTALSLLQESATLAREHGDLWCLAHALGVAGLERCERNELHIAHALLEECLQVARKAEDKQGLRWGLIGLGIVMIRQNKYGSADALLEEAVAVTRQLGEHYATAMALRCRGDVAFIRGHYARAAELLDEAIDLLHEIGATRMLIVPLVLRAHVAAATGAWDAANTLLDQALSLAPPGTPERPPALEALGAAAAKQGRLTAARRLLEEALELARAEADEACTSAALYELAELFRADGDLKRAAVVHDEALHLRAELGVVPWIAESLDAIAGVVAADGRYHDAVRLLGAATAQREACGAVIHPREARLYQSDLTRIRQQLAANEVEAALARGARLSLAEAIDHASIRRSARSRPVNGWSSLTQREHQVADLVAAGLTNPQIAQRLFVSLGMVKAHLSRIFKKMGLEGRRELAREVRHRQREAAQNGQ